MNFCLHCLLTGKGLFETDRDNECPNHGGSPELIDAETIQAIGKLYGTSGELPPYTADMW